MDSLEVIDLEAELGKMGFASAELFGPGSCEEKAVQSVTIPTEIEGISVESKLPTSGALPAHPVTLESRTPEQLVELAGTPGMLGAVRLEVFSRLQQDPRKANLFTFRWLLPTDAKDQEDAFDGLMAVCWKEVKFRHASIHGELSDSEDTERTRDEIKDALVDTLYRHKSLEPFEVIRKVLSGEFHTDADVANAVRRRALQERRNHSLLEFAPPDEDEGEGSTLRRVLYDDPDSRTNRYSDAVDLITEESGKVEGIVGEKGREVLLDIVEHIDADSLPTLQREREQVLTEIIAAKHGVKERQARTHKSRFRRAFEDAVRAGNPVLVNVAKLLGWEWRT